MCDATAQVGGGRGGWGTRPWPGWSVLSLTGRERRHGGQRAQARGSQDAAGVFVYRPEDEKCM